MLSLSRSRHRVGTFAALTVLLVGSACSDPATPQTAAEPATKPPSASQGSPSSPATTPMQPSASPTTEAPRESPSKPSGPSVNITVAGPDITPNGARVKVKRGEELQLRFDTDRAGELHVHSTPEQVVKFPAGKSTRVLVVRSPGVAEVEEHETSFVVLQLEVS